MTTDKNEKKHTEWTFIAKFPAFFNSKGSFTLKHQHQCCDIAKLKIADFLINQGHCPRSELKPEPIRYDAGIEDAPNISLTHSVDRP